MHQIGRIDPRDMTVQDWTAAVTLDLEQFGSVPQLWDETRWRDWATAVIGMSAISGVVLPDPSGFLHWSEWAARFNEIMDGWSG